MLDYMDTRDITSSLLDEIADGYAEGYGIDPDDIEIVNRHAVAARVDEMPQEFLYWLYVVAILEDIIDDSDGWRSRDYANDAAALERMFGRSSSIEAAPIALAYARAQLLLSTPSYTANWLDAASVERDIDIFLDGVTDWDAIEAMAKLEQTMWRNFVC